MRKLLFLLFPAFLALSILNCSNNDDMPCMTCDSRGQSLLQNSFGYCYRYIGGGSYSCDYMSASDCGGSFYTSSNCGGNYQPNTYGYCYYYSGVGSYSCSYMSASDCDWEGGNLYSSSNCGGNWHPSSSSSSSRPSSSSSADCGVVTIGDQVWQKCNLNLIPSHGNSSCYNGQSGNCTVYGRLYDWVAAMDLPDDCYDYYCGDMINSPHRGICPFGWHIPSMEEWFDLVSYVESNRCYYGGCATRHLKAYSGWNSGGNGEDSYDFSALPGGSYDPNIGFYDVGEQGFWWSADESAIIFSGSDDDPIYLFPGDSQVLFSVRCLRDY